MPPPLKKAKRRLAKSSESQDFMDNFTDHDEYNSQIFKIQTEELLKEVNVEMIPDQWINQLQDFLKNMSETYQHSIDDFPLSSVHLPIIKKKSEKGSFKFLPPEKITVIGSFELKTVCSASLPYMLDMGIKIPKACWQSMDYLNERYHRKCSLYLAFIAQSLQEAEFVEDMKFSYQNGCHLKPVLLITPKGIKDKVVSLTAYPSENAFKLTRFIPPRNNVRSSWLLGKSENDLEVPTPYYNSTILADLQLSKLNDYLKENITHENIKDGIKLVKLWLIQRGLLSGYGRFNGFIISMFIVYLLKKEKINCFMNPYQVFRCTMLALQHENFEEGISLADEHDDKPPLEDFKKTFPGVFLDESGFLNLLYSVNKETLDMVKHEAKLGLNILESEVPNCFFLLFLKKISPLEKFEYLIHLKGPKKFRKYSKKLCDTQDALNYGENKIAAVVPKVCDILRKGLNKRILLLDVIKSCSAPWSISNKPPSPNCGEVMIGVLLNPDVSLSNIEKGPPADEPEAKEFRKFWGDQSEMRRFQDATIREAVYWPANTFEDRRKVFSHMINDILKRHLNSEKNFVVNGCDVDSVLHIPKRILSSDFLHYGTGEEAYVTLSETFNSLSKQLRKLDGLPLQITSIQGISPSFRYSDVFPPLPISFHDHVRIMPDSRNKRKKRKRNDLKMTPFIPALNVVIEFEGSGKWPNDIEGIKKLKTSFLIKIVELVKAQYSLFAVPFLTHADIIKDGFVFRLFIAVHKELYLMKKHTLPNGMIKMQDTDESRQLDLTINIYPKLNSLLHGLQLQHFTYGTACRLAKRWISAQLKAEYIHSTAVELLVAHVYTHPEPLTCPSSPQTGFIRFLSLIVNHDWNISPLIVNLNNELQKNEIEEIYTKFTDQRSTLPPMVIATPFDKRGTLWTKNKPLSLILKRMIILAKASLETLQNNMLNMKEFDVKCIFRPPLESFDIIIHLNHHTISKLMYAVDVGELTELPLLKAYDGHRDKGYPNVELDIPKAYFEQLKETFGEFAYFFYDVYGGDFIGIVWKKSAFSSKEMKTSHMNCRFLKDNSVVASTESILEDIKLLGSGIINCITKQKDL